MKINKGFAPIAIVLIIIAVLFVGGIAYYAGKSSKTPLQDTNLDWKTYVDSGSGASFSYPPSYVVKTEKIERQAGVFYDQIVILDPNSMSNSPDKIYLGIPYTGASDPASIYEIKENVNNTFATFAISLQASNYAKYIFDSIVASVKK